MRALFAALLLSAPAHSQPAPDPAALMRSSIEAVKANAAKARQYAFREYKVNRDLDKNGAETDRETETWDVIGLEGSTYRKLILRNDKPLPAKEQKREEERLQKEAARRKNETAEERRNRTLSFSYSFAFPYKKTPEIYSLQYRGEEVIGGRRAHIVEGMPKPDYRPRNDSEKEALNYRMKVWLDAEEYCFARIELEVVGEHSRMQKGSLILQEDVKHEDGVWLPKVTSFRYYVRFFKMVGGRGDHTTTYSDYRKFQVDSRILEAADK